MKKMLSIILTLVLLLSLVPMVTFVVGAATSGTTGDCRWLLNGTVLTISGKGKMGDYDSYGNQAPWGTSITEIIIENGVTSIGRDAFYNCNLLKEVYIPNNVECIGDGAFESCDKLEVIDIPYNIQSIGAGVFYDTGYYNKKSNWCDDVLYIDGHLICAEKTISGSYYIRDFTISIASSAFAQCESLTFVSIPNSVRYIATGAFARCTSLQNVKMAYGVIKIGSLVFTDCTSLNSVNIVDSVISIGINCFEGCTNLKNVTIGKGVEVIQFQTFKNCTNLNKICFPKNVKLIKEDAFAGCKNLEEIEGDCLLEVDKNAFKGCDKLKSIIANHLKEDVTLKSTIKEDGVKAKYCFKCDEITIEAIIKQIKTIKLSSTKYTYNGKTKTPSVTVKDSTGKKLKKNTDYTITYAKGRKKVGTYKVVVKMKGKYSGTKTLTFKINPAKTSVKKLTAAKRSLKVTIKKQSKQVTGYQIQYSTSKKFKSAKTKTIKNYKTTSATLKSLKAKKTYYVRVRTYKTVDGKKYYSGWSKVVKKKTK